MLRGLNKQGVLVVLALVAWSPASAWAQDPCAAQNAQMASALAALGASNIQIEGGDCKPQRPQATIPSLDLARPSVPGRGESPAHFTRGNTAQWTGRYDEAARAYYDGAMLGDPGCAMQLATLYTYGLGVAKDVHQAQAWLQVAFRDNRLLSERSMRYNFYTFLDLASHDYPDAQYAVGRAYAENADGWQPSGDHQRGKDWLARASANGSVQARDLLTELNRPKGLSAFEQALKAWEAQMNATMTSTHEQFSAQQRRVHRENCQAYMQGRDRPCYMTR